MQSDDLNIDLFKRILKFYNDRKDMEQRSD